MSAPIETFAVYYERLAQRQNQAAALSRSERLTSRLRLACVLAAIATFWVGFDTGLFPASLALLFIPAFAFLVIHHDRTIRRLRRTERAVAFYERAIARIEDRWLDHGSPGDAFVDPHHPYSGDLDLFGRGSLFSLLCAARTRSGEHTLARWLNEPAQPPVAIARQAAVADLRDRLDLREDLAVIGDTVRAGLEPNALTTWSMSPLTLAMRWPRVVAPILVLAVAATGIAWALDSLGPLPFLAAVVAEVLFVWSLRGRVRQVLLDVQQPTRDLDVLVAVLARIEREAFSAPLLLDVKRGLAVAGAPPSAQIARLRRIVDLLDTRKNELFAPIAALLLWGTQCALAIESWRRDSAAAVPHWIAAVGDFEALLSLAGFAFENPSYTFPKFCEEAPRIAAKGLGHPLLARTTRIANDVELGADQRVLLVSGSNMSGKSTLLRTVGVNVVLAQAGAPVCASELHLSPLAIGASLRIVDSLQTGTSHFYAELKRLRQIVDLTDGPQPVLFLLDEILHGTNSHDRRIGAEAVVRELVRRGAIGLVTTHDLALAEIANDNAVGAVNVHFEDHIEAGEMRFDYRMHAGVVRKSNALELMRAVGLKV